MKLKNMIKSGLMAGLLAAVVCACSGAGSVANDGGSGLPAIPAGVTASQGTIADSVLVKWDAVDNAGYYVIYKAIDKAESFKVISSMVKGTEYNDTAVYKGQVYYYRISAAIGNTWSDPSEIANGFLQDNTPVPPQNVTGPGIDHANCAIGSITVKWDDVDAAQSYIVRRYERKYGAYTEVATVTDGTSYTDNTVTADTIYWYRIVSVNSDGLQGIPSEPVMGLARQQVPVWDAAAVLTATDNYVNKIQVTWPAATYAATYSIYRSDSTDPIATGITDLTYDDRGYAAADTEYTYSVVAISTGGSATLGNTDTGRTLTIGGLADPIDPPTGVFASKGKTNLITITWNAEEGAAAYSVYRNTENDSATAVKVADKITTLSYDNAMIPVVNDRTTYYYWVTAYNATYDETSLSSVASGYANPDKPGVPVVATPVIDYSEGSITVSWTAADAWTKRYTVYRSADGGETYNAVSENQAGTSITEYIATLENGTVQAGVGYLYSIKAINDVGESAQSDAVTGLFPLNAPGNFSAVKEQDNMSAARIGLSWDAVKGATSYRIQRRVKRPAYSWGEWADLTTVTTLTYTDSGLSGTRYYDYRVQAVNGAAASGWSDDDEIYMVW